MFDPAGMLPALALGAAWGVTCAILPYGRLAGARVAPPGGRAARRAAGAAGDAAGDAGRPRRRRPSLPRLARAKSSAPVEAQAIGGVVIRLDGDGAAGDAVLPTAAAPTAKKTTDERTPRSASTADVPDRAGDQATTSNDVASSATGAAPGRRHGELDLDDAPDTRRFRVVSVVQHALAVPIGAALVYLAHRLLEGAVPADRGVQFGSAGDASLAVPAILLGLAALPLPVFLLGRVLSRRTVGGPAAYLLWQRSAYGADPIGGARLFAVLVAMLAPAWTVFAGSAFARLEEGTLRFSGLGELRVHEIRLDEVTAIDLYDGVTGDPRRGAAEPFAVITLADGRQWSTRGRGLAVDRDALEVVARVAAEVAGVEARRRGRFMVADLRL